MQRIERNTLAQAQISGGTGKGSSDASSSSTVDLNLSGAQIQGNVDLTINATSSATAGA